MNTPRIMNTPPKRKAFLELRVPPVIVFILSAFLMWGAARLIPAWRFDLPWRGPLSALFIFIGILLGLKGLSAFHRVRTTSNPVRPDDASSLVTSGVYRITRNPMYLGLLFLLAAWALRISNGVSLLLLPAFVIYMTRFQIIPEERALASKFGESFDSYRRSVRRWL